MTAHNTDGERGVTPVVGIVLLIAITILLAATVAAFALGFEDSTGQPQIPNAAFGFDYEHDAGGNDRLEILHESGRTVDADHLYVVIEGASCDASGDDPNGRHPATGFPSAPSDISAGTMLVVDGDTTPVDCTNNELNLRGSTVMLVWDDDTGTTRTYQTWEAP